MSKNFPDAIGLDTVAKRVRYIMSLMASGEWLRSRFYRLELAELWGVTDSAIKLYSAEASRALEFDPEETAQLKAQLAATFLRLAKAAEMNVNQITGQSDLKTAIDAMRLYGDYAGCDPRTVGPSAATGPAVMVTLNCNDGIAKAAPMAGDEKE